MLFLPDALPDVLVLIVVIRLLFVLSGRLCAHAFSRPHLRWQASLLLLPPAVLPCAVNEYNKILVCRNWRTHVRVLLPQLNIVDLI
jgi:hypothetical protein